MREIHLTAPAKLNLTLDILRRRPDGYHDLRMVMQSISLCDTVTLGVETGSKRIDVHTDSSSLPGGPDNLAYRAADAFFSATDLPNAGVAITLEKRIPVCAGMAGGSSDAAAVLRALRALLYPDLPDRELERIGERIGSDVPFCVRGGTALAEGRGERLTDLPPLPPCYLAICKPNFGLSTPELFGRVHLDALQHRPDTQALQKALEDTDLSAIAASLGNVFEEVLTPEEAATISAIETTLRHSGALNAIMTGSGPTVFGLFSEKSAAQSAVATLQPQYPQTFLATPLLKEV